MTDVKRVFKAVVFDMDGIIFDTERLIQDCWDIVAKRHGIEGARETCTACLGLNYQSVIRIFTERYGADFDFEFYQKEVRALFFGDLYGTHLPIKKGAINLLRALKENEIPVALATSTSRAAVMKELEDADLLQYFDEIVCGDMVSHSKPHPEIFLTACERLNVQPEDAYAIEDSFNGIRSASAGGLRPIMVPDILAPIPEIEALTEVICTDLDEVLSYLL